MGSLLSVLSSNLISDLGLVGKRTSSAGSSEDNRDIPEYDFIIVGGGTAGCVLASRMSENPTNRVLLLEAGGSGQSLLLTRVPSASALLLHDPNHTYQLYTESQVHLTGHKRFWPRGKMLGGCSSINAQMAQYGDAGDFDEWASITGDEGWSWKNFQRYFRKFEGYKDDPKGLRIDDQTFRGTDGPLKVGYFSKYSESSKAFVEACTKSNIPPTSNFNTDAGTLGVDRAMTYIDQSCTRSSSETAYLTEEVLDRPNLKVAIHASVTKILFDTSGSEPTAVGVEFSQGKGKPVYRATARKEIILSAGAIHSPHILQVSGVGPAETLTEHGIPVVKDLAGVGAHLMDHPVVSTRLANAAAPKYFKPETIWEHILVVIVTLQFLIFRSGPLSTNWGEAAAFVNTNDSKIFPQSEYSAGPFESSSSTPNGPDLEILTTPLAYLDHGVVALPGFTVQACLVRPLSTGTVKLKSADPWVNPAIDPRYLENKADLHKLVRGLRFCLNLGLTEPLSSLVDRGSKNPNMDQELYKKTDEELVEVVKERCETLYHPTSTCRMAPLDRDGVLDSQLRVYGIRNLRVCDASVYPTIVAGHTAGAAFAVAERLADILKDEYMGKGET